MHLLEKVWKTSGWELTTKYTSRGLRRRGNTNKWHVTLSHRDPLTGELVPSYHAVEARTEKQAAKKRDEPILDLERKGSAYTSRLTLAEFLEKFIMDEYRAIIEGYLEEDARNWRKQRHTAKRIYERLRDEHGCEASESTVRHYVVCRIRTTCAAIAVASAWNELICPP